MKDCLHEYGSVLQVIHNITIIVEGDFKISFTGCADHAHDIQALVAIYGLNIKIIFPNFMLPAPT